MADTVAATATNGSNICTSRAEHGAIETYSRISAQRTIRTYDVSRDAGPRAVRTNNLIHPAKQGAVRTYEPSCSAGPGVVRIYGRTHEEKGTSAGADKRLTKRAAIVSVSRELVLPNNGWADAVNEWAVIMFRSERCQH